ncbi:MAG: methyltransferase domain-containing protein, partial [Hyphomicrobiales bacterium]
VDQVTGIEADATLAARASENLARLGYANASVIAGGVEAVADRQFDVILVQGALDAAPEELKQLLAEGGRIVVPILRRGVATAHVFTRNDGGVMFTSEFDATMPRLWAGTAGNEFVF